MKLKKIIASVSAAAIAFGSIPTVWAESTDVSEDGVSILPTDFEPVTYYVSDLYRNGQINLIDPYAEEPLLKEVDIPEKTKDISICFDVDYCDTVITAWGNLAGNNWDIIAGKGIYSDQLGSDDPKFVFNENGSYEMVIPTGLLLEEALLKDETKLEYLESLIILSLNLEGDIEYSWTTITITDIKAYQKSHALEECTFSNVVDKPNDDESDFTARCYGSTAYITGYTGKDKNVTIPNEIKGRTNIEIDEHAFNDLDFIETITLSANVTGFLSPEAFDGCSSLKAIYADEKNTNFSSIDGVLYNKDKTSLYAYPTGKTDSTYYIPDTVTSIPTVYNIFNNCTYLTAIYVGDENKSFSSLDGVLYNKDKTTIICYPAGKEDKNYSIPNSVKYINYYCFYNNKNLTSVTIPESVEAVTGNAFANCTSLTSAIILADKAMFYNRPEKGDGNTPSFGNCLSLTVYIHESSWIKKDLDSGKGADYINVEGKTLPYKILDKEAAYDDKNGVLLENPNLEGTTLTVTVADGSTDTKITYNITLKDENGNEIQPQGDVTVKIPLPEGWDGAKTIVSRHETDGTYTNMNAVFENGYMVFVTEHFSEYVLSYGELEPDAPAAENTTISDSTTTPDDENKPTGLVIGIVPAIIAGAAVVLSKKRK